MFATEILKVSYSGSTKTGLRFTEVMPKILAIYVFAGTSTSSPSLSHH